MVANGFQACLSVSSTPMSHMSTQPASFHQSWPMYCCITRATHACHTAATVFKGSWRAWDVRCSGPTPGSVPYRPFPLLGEPRSQLSVASFHNVSGGQRPLTALPPPRGRIQGYRGELGNRPWLSDRGCPACPRTELALIPPCHERTDCSVAEHERIERRPSTAPSLEHRPSLIVQGLPSAEERVNEDPVWVNRQTLASQRG